MKVSSVLPFYKQINTNEYRLKKGYTLLLGGDSFNFYRDDGDNVTFYEFEFNLTVSKSSDFQYDVQLLYRGKSVNI